MSKFQNKNYGIITQLDFKSKRTRLLYYLFFALSLAVVMVCIAPPLWMMLSSLKDIREFMSVPPTIIPRTFHPEKIAETWNRLGFGRFYINSLISVCGAVICALFFNGLIAYAISVLKPKGGKIVFYLVLWSMMVPYTVSLVPLFKNIVALKLTNTFVPLWLSFGANAFYVLLYKSFFDALPGSLIEAARLDGCSNLGMFFRIVAPLSKAVNMVIAIFAVNAAWSDFLLPLLVLKDKDLYTVMVKLFQTREVGGLSVDYQMMAICFSIVPPVLLFILFQKYITQGIALSGIKG